MTLITTTAKKWVNIFQKYKSEYSLLFFSFCSAINPPQEWFL